MINQNEDKQMQQETNKDFANATELQKTYWIHTEEIKMLKAIEENRKRVLRAYLAATPIFQTKKNCLIIYGTAGEIDPKSAENLFYQPPMNSGTGNLVTYYQRACISVLSFIQGISYLCYQKSTDMLQNMKEKHVKRKIGNGISCSKIT